MSRPDGAMDKVPGKAAEEGEFGEGGYYDEGYGVGEPADAGDGEFDSKYDEAMALNAKLRQMVAAAETGELDLPPEMVAMLSQSAGVGPATQGSMGSAAMASSLPGGGALLGTKRKPKKKTVKPAPKPGARALAKSNYTFDDDRLGDIGRGNLMLMDRLTKINSGAGVMQTRQKKVALRSSSAINRGRAAQKIVNDNAAFLKRLQSVKATSSFSRDTLKRSAAKQNRMKSLRRTVDGPGPRPRARKPKASKKSAPLPDMVF